MNRTAQRQQDFQHSKDSQAVLSITGSQRCDVVFEAELYPVQQENLNENWHFPMSVWCSFLPGMLLEVLSIG